MEKFKIVNRDHGRAQKKPFFCFRMEITFFGKVGPKNEIVNLSSNLVPRLI